MARDDDDDDDDDVPYMGLGVPVYGVPVHGVPVYVIVRRGCCEGGISILGACILHMQAGPAYACIQYLTHNKPV